jgi:hypothetical protein
MRRWREPGPLVRVRSKHVVPDSTNREQTLLSVEHVHYIAQRFGSEGFRARAPGSVAGHDVPVLVRGGSACALGAAALAAWRRRSGEHAGFPRCDVAPGASTFYCSLGNGHFNQALNLYRLNWPSIFTGARYVVPPGDDALREAIEEGVESLVLRSETPRQARKELSLLLNKAHAAKWYVRDDTGDVAVWEAGEAEGAGGPAGAGQPDADAGRPVSQFEALSKVCDADELGALLRMKLRVDEAAADAGYAAALAATPPVAPSKL